MSTFLAELLLLLSFSKVIDGLGRKLLSFGVEVLEGVNYNAGTLEEMLGLFIPIQFMLAIFLRAGRVGR